jgi:hypothetical protein
MSISRISGLAYQKNVLLNNKKLKYCIIYHLLVFRTLTTLKTLDILISIAVNHSFVIILTEEKKNEPKNDIWAAVPDGNRSIYSTAGCYARPYDASTSICDLFNPGFMADISY